MIDAFEKHTAAYYTGRNEISASNNHTREATYGEVKSTASCHREKYSI